MHHFTSYAEQKFDILNKHKVFITKENVLETVQAPDKIEKKGKYFFASRENIKVVFLKQANIKKIITFYPIKPE